MADENTVGLYVELYTKNFEESKRRLDAMISSMESNLDSLEKKQKEAAQAAKAQADAEKKAADAAEAAARKQETALNKAITGIRRFQIAAAVAIGAAVVAYKELDKAATELGDTEAIAQFKAMDDAIGAFKDTLLEAGLDMLKIVDAVNIITDSLGWMQEVVAKSISGWAGFFTFVQGIVNAVGQMADLTKGKAVVIDVKAIVKNAQAAVAQTYGDLTTVTGRRKEVEAQSEAEKEYKKAQDKKAKDLEDYISKTHDLTIKSGESILEAEKDYHDKSAEAWQSYMEKVADITADGIKKRADLARTRSESIASAETDYQRSIEDAQYSHGQKLVDIERDYQQAIRNAQQTYQEDALDAIRNLDAIGLVRAKEKRDKDLANAETSRNEANTAESENYSRQLYEAQRAFEDKRREAELAYQRGLDDQKRAEAQALQDAKNTYNQQVTDAAKGYADKQAAIDQAYRNENAAAANQYGYSEQAYRNHLVAMQNILAQYGIGNVTPIERTRVRRRAEGGLDLVSSPTHFLAGEAGPEIVYTAPLNRSVPVMTPQIVQHTGDFSHSIDAAISSSVAGLDGRIVAVVRKALAEVIR